MILPFKKIGIGAAKVAIATLIIGHHLLVGAQENKAADTDEAPGWDLRFDKGLTIESQADNTELRIGGRLHLDTASIQDDFSQTIEDSQVRRARAYVAGKFGEHWRFRVEREFANGREGWRNLWAQYRISNKTWVKAGNFVAPFGLEDIAASNHATFLERSLPSAIAPSYQTGIGIGHRGKIGDTRRRHHYSWSIAVGSAPLGDSEEDRHRSDHQSITTRLAYAPIAEKRRVLHFGAALEHRSINSDSQFRVRSRPESSLAPALLNTGMLDDVNSSLSYGLESAAVFGSFSTQAEYMSIDLTRGADRPDPTFSGWYLQTSYVLTGEQRKYSRSTGSFNGISPERTWGGVELAARVSHLNLNDETVQGGEARNLTLGVNWYVNDNTRLMFNYVNVDANRRSDNVNENPSIYQLRILTFF